MPLDDLLKDVNLTEGVRGSWVCDNTGRVVTRVFRDTGTVTPEACTPDILQIAATVDLYRPAGGDLVFSYANGVIVLRVMDMGCLVVFCAPSVDLSHLRLTINVVAPSLARQIKGRGRDERGRILERSSDQGATRLLSLLSR